MLRMCGSPSRSHGIRTAWLLIVMPRSRSMSIRSRYCARIDRSETTPVICSIRSASVDLPWSMWAMMQKLRISSGGVADGWRGFRARGDISGQFYGPRRPPRVLAAADPYPETHGRPSGARARHPDVCHDVARAGDRDARAGQPGERGGPARSWLADGGAVH